MVETPKFSGLAAELAPYADLKPARKVNEAGWIDYAIRSKVPHENSQGLRISVTYAQGEGFFVCRRKQGDPFKTQFTLDCAGNVPYFDDSAQGLEGTQHMHRKASSTLHIVKKCSPENVDEHVRNEVEQIVHEIATLGVPQERQVGGYVEDGELRVRPISRGNGPER